ncbi:hypothetical protein NEFER01_1525, partial [Nematocida sp. LUAm1]
HAHRTKHAPVNAQKTHSKTMQMYIPHRMGIFSPVVKSVKSMQTQTPFLADTWIGEMNNRSNAQPKDYNFHKMIYTHARSMLIKTYEELASAKNGLITAQSQSKVIEMELQKIKNALEDEKDYIDELNTEIDEYIAECQNKTEELVKKNAMLQKVQIDLDQCVEKRNEYLRSIEELVQNATAEKTQADKKLNELYKQNDQLNTKYNKLLEEKKKLEKKQEELQEEKITLQKKQERLQEEKSVLQKGQKELKQQIYQCEKQNMEKQAALESRLKKITEENNILTEQLAKIKEMTQSIVHANKTIDQLEQDKKDLTLTILNLEKRIEDLDNSIALDRKKIEKLSNENENERVEKDKRIKHLEDRQKELETQKETLDSTQQEMETQYNTLNNKYITLQQDLEKSMAAQNDASTRTEQSYNNQIEILSNAITSSTKHKNEAKQLYIEEEEKYINIADTKNNLIRTQTTLNECIKNLTSIQTDLENSLKNTSADGSKKSNIDYTKLLENCNENMLDKTICEDTIKDLQNNIYLEEKEYIGLISTNKKDLKAMCKYLESYLENISSTSDYSSVFQPNPPIHMLNDLLSKFNSNNSIFLIAFESYSEKIDELKQKLYEIPLKDIASSIVLSTPSKEAIDTCLEKVHAYRHCVYENYNTIFCDTSNIANLIIKNIIKYTSNTTQYVNNIKKTNHQSIESSIKGQTQKVIFTEKTILLEEKRKESKENRLLKLEKERKTQTEKNIEIKQTIEKTETKTVKIIQEIERIKLCLYLKNLQTDYNSNANYIEIYNNVSEGDEFKEYKDLEKDIETINRFASQNDSIDDIVQNLEDPKYLLTQMYKIPCLAKDKDLAHNKIGHMNRLVESNSKKNNMLCIIKNQETTLESQKKRIENLYIRTQPKYKKLNIAYLYIKDIDYNIITALKKLMPNILRSLSEFNVDMLQQIENNIGLNNIKNLHAKIQYADVFLKNFPIAKTNVIDHFSLIYLTAIKENKILTETKKKIVDDNRMFLTSFPKAKKVPRSTSVP